jgi:hypothetical protein
MLHFDEGERAAQYWQCVKTHESWRSPQRQRTKDRKGERTSMGPEIFSVRSPARRSDANAVNTA